MIMQGVMCMFLGMGTVYVFLWLLVLVLQYGSIWLGRYFPDAPETDEPAVNPAVDRDRDIIALIAAAIKRHEIVKKKG